MKKNKISKNWVNKQRRDTFVKQSKVDGYRARSAYKLIEIDEKFKIFKGGLSIIDIGAAPGSWSQYAVKAAKNGRLISIDLKKMELIGNTVQIQGDFTEENIQNEIKKLFDMYKEIIHLVAERIIEYGSITSDDIYEIFKKEDIYNMIGTYNISTIRNEIDKKLNS